MRLVELKDINPVIDEIKKDITELMEIEIKDTDKDKIKELKAVKKELETTLKTLQLINAPQDTINQIKAKITEIDKELDKKTDKIQLTDKQKALLKILELYGVKINKTTGNGGKTKKNIIIIDKNGNKKEYSFYTEIARDYSIEIGKDSGKRAILRRIKETDIKTLIENGVILFEAKD